LFLTQCSERENNQDIGNPRKLLQFNNNNNNENGNQQTEETQTKDVFKGFEGWLPPDGIDSLDVKNAFVCLFVCLFFFVVVVFNFSCFVVIIFWFLFLFFICCSLFFFELNEFVKEN
jgi:hypothetical protein